MAIKASLRKTYKNQTEADVKVWALNRETERALDTLASFYGLFVHQLNSDVADKFEEIDDAMAYAQTGPERCGDGFAGSS